MTDKIIVCRNAKTLLKFNNHPKKDEFKMYLDVWANEKKVFAIIKVVACKSVGFALLHKVERDPLKEHQNPWVLDLIFVTSSYRKKGHASSMLREMQKHNILEVTAFYPSDEGAALLAKHGFTGNDVIMRLNDKSRSLKQ